MYRRFIVVTTIVKRTDDLGRISYRPKVPCKISSLCVVQEGKHITDELKDHVGEEVMALVGTKRPTTQAMRDFEGRLPLRFKLVRQEPAYIKHWPYKKRDRVISADVKTHIEVLYDGPDKEDPHQFRKWKEDDGSISD